MVARQDRMNNRILQLTCSQICQALSMLWSHKLELNCRPAYYVNDKSDGCALVPTVRIAWSRRLLHMGPLRFI